MKAKLLIGAILPSLTLVTMCNVTQLKGKCNDCHSSMLFCGTLCTCKHDIIKLRMDIQATDKRWNETVQALPCQVKFLPLKTYNKTTFQNQINLLR
jgi:hypothetical protein